MANKITDTDIIKINTLYLAYNNKAKVARETGFSASTISKYIIPGFVLNPEIETKEIKTIPINKDNFKSLNWNVLLILSRDEIEDMEKLRKEVTR